VIVVVWLIFQMLCKFCCGNTFCIFNSWF